MVQPRNSQAELERLYIIFPICFSTIIFVIIDYKGKHILDAAESCRRNQKIQSLTTDHFQVMPFFLDQIELWSYFSSESNISDSKTCCLPFLFQQNTPQKSNTQELRQAMLQPNLVTSGALLSSCEKVTAWHPALQLFQAAWDPKQAVDVLKRWNVVGIKSWLKNNCGNTYHFIILYYV